MLTTLPATGREDAIRRLCAELLAALPGSPLEVTYGKPKKRRSLPQNSFSHAWYGEIAHALPEEDAMGWKCYCKLHHGVPILRTDDEDFRAAYDQAIKPLSYENKLVAMRIFPVTSLMTKKQLTTYADAVQSDFAGRGVFLEVRL